MTDRIIHPVSKSSNLTPWLNDLLNQDRNRAETARMKARITSEVPRTINQ